MIMTSNDNLCQDKQNDDQSPFHSDVCYLNKGEEDEMEIYGYERNSLRIAFTWICIILTLGILRLIFHWYRHWMLYCTHHRCPLQLAHSVLVVDRYQESHITYYVRTVRKINLENLSPGDVAVVCNDLDIKDVTRIITEAGSLVRMHFNDGSYTDESNFIEIQIKKLSYVWRYDKGAFCKLAGIDKGLQKADFHNARGYSRQQQLLRRIVYGSNEILVKVNTYWELICLEFLNPFYIFQAFSLVLWFIELYLYYSFAIISMSLFGIIMTVLQTRRSQQQLAETVKVHGNVVVFRHVGPSKYEDICQEVPISSLVPGDVIQIPRTGFVVPCDAVLLSGQCIVNESMLTGESVPVTKTALPSIKDAPYVEKEDVNHTLYCGTHVLQARYYANEDIKAVVLRTGYLTAKGSLVRSILYPIPHDFKFDQDVRKFVWILGFIAIVGTTYGFITKMMNGDGLFETIIDSIDIITIVIPPALPAALSVGKYYAQNRLQKHKITCVNASVINVSGSINCVCFDKTGTLTEDGLDFYGVIPAEDRSLRGMLTDLKNSELTNLKEAMASCHSLTLINGVISGDPLDVKMFESTGWILDETELTDDVKYDLLAPTIVKSPVDSQEIGIIHQFQFSSSLQRMSVITRHLNSKELTIYCKGSPEMVSQLSTRESGKKIVLTNRFTSTDIGENLFKNYVSMGIQVPKDLDLVLERQTEKGYRVLAIGYRTFPAIDIIKLKKLRRVDVERDLIFAGLIVFENKLKPQTTSIISHLKHAEMKIVMLTGDNIQTAICVAKECGIVDADESIVIVDFVTNNNHRNPRLTYKSCGTKPPKFMTMDSRVFSIGDLELGSKSSNRKYALTGHTWAVIREFHPNFIKSVLKDGVIFARMSSDQKQQVIQELQSAQFYVAMCGDGANDCGALKTADVGISLSEAESSVASPFTSHQPNISCVPTIIKEGRAALVTAFGLFKFMVLYSLLEFLSTVLLFTFRSALSDMEFLYIDIFLIVVFAFFFGQTKPFSGPLVPTAPTSSLLSAVPLASVLLQLLLMVAVQIVAEISIRQFPWYEPLGNPNNEYHTYDNYAVYGISQFEYIILAISFSSGRPYREPIYNNTYLFSSLILMTIVSGYIVLYPSPFVLKLFEFALPPMDYRLFLVVLSMVTFVMSMALETFVTNYVVRKLSSLTKNKRQRKKFMSFKMSDDILGSSVDNFSGVEVKCYGSIKS